MLEQRELATNYMSSDAAGMHDRELIMSKSGNLPRTFLVSDNEMYKSQQGSAVGSSIDLNEMRERTDVPLYTR